MTKDLHAMPVCRPPQQKNNLHSPWEHRCAWAAQQKRKHQQQQQNQRRQQQQRQQHWEQEQEQGQDSVIEQSAPVRKIPNFLEA